VLLPFSNINARIADGWRDKLDRDNMVNGIVAHYIHSCEGAHLARSVNAAVEDGIQDILSVHDCFACHAPKVNRFAQIRRLQLTLFYERNPLGQLVWRYVNSVQDLPQLGQLDPFALQYSENFDR
jgi:DNA-directed RNA polymerase